jgi:hypothetical protein
VPIFTCGVRGRPARSAIFRRTVDLIYDAAAENDLAGLIAAVGSVRLPAEDGE